MALTNQEILALQQMMNTPGANAVPFGIAGAAANAAAALGSLGGGGGGGGGAFYPGVHFVSAGTVVAGGGRSVPGGGGVVVVTHVGGGGSSPTFDPLPTGMKVEDLVGWRIWRVRNDHLWSYSADYAWMPGDVSDGEPGDHDSAGIWAFKEKRRAFQKAVESGAGYVWGSVRLWGHVVEHADGYRASKARIVSLDGCTRDITPEMMTDLCRLYRVPEIEIPMASLQPTQPVRNRVAVWKVLPSSPSVNPTPTAISDDGSVLVGTSPSIMKNNSFEPKPDKPWPVIWIVGGMLLLCVMMPLLRP